MQLFQGLSKFLAKLLGLGAGFIHFPISNRQFFTHNV
jgi:hypothetical protein